MSSMHLKPVLLSRQQPPRLKTRPRHHPARTRPRHHLQNQDKANILTNMTRTRTRHFKCQKRPKRDLHQNADKNYCPALLFVPVLERSLNNHSVDATAHFLGNRSMRAITIICIKSYNFELELIDTIIWKVPWYCLVLTTRPRQHYRDMRQDRDPNPQDNGPWDQGQGT
jgi:hypothetical protein